MPPPTSSSLDMEPFTLIEESRPSQPFHLFDQVRHLSDAHTADHDLQYLHELRKAFPELIATAVPANNINLRAFAAAGFATYELDTKTDSFASWRGYNGPSPANRRGSLAEVTHFAKYIYHWAGETFIVYLVGGVQYVLKERREGENPLGPSRATDALITAAGRYALEDIVWVFDGYWRGDKNLYREVAKASWDKVILDEGMKQDLVSVAEKFFSSKEVYEDLGVPWKRGLLFHGPPGNGKTISIKALMHTLLKRKVSIPTLYVKSAANTYAIGAVFAQARQLAPCMLVLEDIETIVRDQTRSYFFNQMDGLENNNGLFVVASTNFLDRLDPGLTKRPSRFDRKYLFPQPNEHERTLYCEYWRRKLAKKPDLEFPPKLSPAMAHITPGFSFAFLQECFVATLLVLATRDEAAASDDDDKDLDQYILWTTFKQQAALLRKQIDDTKGTGYPQHGNLPRTIPAPAPQYPHDLSFPNDDDEARATADFDPYPQQNFHHMSLDPISASSFPSGHLPNGKWAATCGSIPPPGSLSSFEPYAASAAGPSATPPDVARRGMFPDLYDPPRRSQYVDGSVHPDSRGGRAGPRNEYTPTLNAGKILRINPAAYMLS